MTNRAILKWVLLLFTGFLFFSCYHQSTNQLKNEIVETKSKIKGCLIPNIFNPVYSIDDKYIIFEGKCNKKSSIFRINSDGTGLKQLTAPFGYSDAYPQILPGNKILFTSYEFPDACGDLCIMNIDGTDPKWLTINGKGGNWHSYSKNADEIYFVSGCDNGNYSKEQNTFDIFTIKLDGTNRNKITDFKDFYIRYLSVSDDGKSLIFQRQTFNRDPKDEALWKLSLDMAKEYFPIKPDIHEYLSNYKSLKIKNKILWPNAYSNMTSPKYSPDGNSILFVWSGHYQGHFGHEIYLIDIKSNLTKKLTNLKEIIVSPSFSNDDKKIIFSVGDVYINHKPTKFTLWRINIDGSNLENIVISK